MDGCGRKGDVSKAAEAQGIINAAVKNFGRLDILVNNSGVYEFAPIEAVTEAQFHRMFNINVLGLLLTTQAAGRYLCGAADHANIGSGVSRVTPPNLLCLHRNQAGGLPRLRA